jgi:hypothetical protein
MSELITIAVKLDYIKKVLQSESDSMFQELHSNFYHKDFLYHLAYIDRQRIESLQTIEDLDLYCSDTRRMSFKDWYESL